MMRWPLNSTSDGGQGGVLALKHKNVSLRVVSAPARVRCEAREECFKCRRDLQRNTLQYMCPKLCKFCVKKK